ncbi:MAG: hypothetical protein ACLQF0_11420 [Dissulfurispiraceae bacterium]
MTYTQDDLVDKILDMYPEIKKHGLFLDLTFSDEKNAWIIKLTRDSKKLTTYLEKQDADECMNNIKCVYLGVQVEQFISNFEERILE